VPAITLPVREVVHATPRTRIISIDLGDADFAFAAGQAVMVGLHGSPLRKPYSIASAPWEVSRTGVMQLLLQVDDIGALDPHLELAAPGTPLDIEGPFGTFGLPDHVVEPLLFVAGGTGIAPLRSMLMEHVARPGSSPVAVVYSARSADELAFRTELDALLHAGRVRSFFTVTRDTASAWDGRRGRINEELLRMALPSPQARCLICGPQQLVTDVRGSLLALGIAEEKILTEHY
jgi:glycine betaine catabolism B